MTAEKYNYKKFFFCFRKGKLGETVNVVVRNQLLRIKGKLIA